MTSLASALVACYGGNASSSKTPATPDDDVRVVIQATISPSSTEPTQPNSTAIAVASTPVASATPQPVATLASAAIVSDSATQPPTFFTQGDGKLPVGAPPPNGTPFIVQFNGTPGPGTTTRLVAGNDPANDLPSFLGLPADQVRNELSQPGATEVSVSVKHGKSRESLIAFVLQNQRQQLDQAVQSGSMTKATADQLLLQFTSNVDKLVDGSPSAGPVIVGPGQAGQNAPFGPGPR